MKTRSHFLALAIVVSIACHSQEDTLRLSSITGYSQELPKANKKILAYTKSKIGQRVGTGYSYDIVDSALYLLNPKWKKKYDGTKIMGESYGKKISLEKAIAGDIVVYENAWMSGAYAGNHIEILFSKNPDDTWNTIGQNIPKKLSESKVMIRTVKPVPISGRISFYRPHGALAMWVYTIAPKKPVDPLKYFYKTPEVNSYDSLPERDRVVRDFKENYLGSEIKKLKWTGSKYLCSAGTISDEDMHKALQRVNYFRRFVGLNDDIVFKKEYNYMAQRAALIMYANNILTHRPSARYRCYTEAGYDGASRSNLALGEYEYRDPILDFIADYGGGNRSVGHRRWILFSKAKVMGFGATNGSAALYVITGEKNKIVPAQDYICYPPKGYVPYQLVFKRWSLSIPINFDCDFTKAKVSMKMKNGKIIKTYIVGRKEADQGYGDPSLVWEVNFMPPDQSLGMRKAAFKKKSFFDNPITVNIDSVIVNGVYKNFEYTVTVIDPDQINSYELSDGAISTSDRAITQKGKR